MHTCSILNKLPLAGAAVLLAACSTIPYQSLPGAEHLASAQLARNSADVCAVLAGVAAELGLEADATSAARQEGSRCVAYFERRSPWWKPGDDGEKLRVEVIGQDNTSHVRVRSKRIAVGQVWITPTDQLLLDRLASRP